MPAIPEGYFLEIKFKTLPIDDAMVSNFMFNMGQGIFLKSKSLSRGIIVLGTFPKINNDFKDDMEKLTLVDKVRFLPIES